jgi:hypothetical protein
MVGTGRRTATLRALTPVHALLIEPDESIRSFRPTRVRVGGSDATNTRPEDGSARDISPIQGCYSFRCWSRRWVDAGYSNRRS